MERSLRLVELRIPLLRPFSSARRTVSHRRTVLLGITAAGLAGWGEAAPYPGVTSESTGDVWKVVREHAPSILAGETPTLPVTAAAALDQARADLAARRAGRPIWARADRAARPVRTCAAIGLQGSPADTLNRVAQAVEAGIREVKIKIEPGRDLDYLAPVRNRFPGLAVAADANGSYRAKDRFLEAVDDLALSYLEQPLPADDPAGHARLRERLATPVCLDESAATPAGARVAIDRGIADVVSLKPGLLGVTAVRRLARRAGAAGIVIKIGGLVETSVGRAHALALAVTTSARFTDLVPPRRLLAGDVSAHPWTLVEGHLRPPEGPGIGIGVDPFAAGSVRYVVRARSIPT